MACNEGQIATGGLQRYVVTRKGAIGREAAASDECQIRCARVYAGQGLGERAAGFEIQLTVGLFDQRGDVQVVGVGDLDRPAGQADVALKVVAAGA